MKKLTTFKIILLIVLCLSFCKPADKENKMTNKDKVVALLTSLETGDHAPIAYINPKEYLLAKMLVSMICFE